MRVPCLCVLLPVGLLLACTNARAGLEVQAAAWDYAVHGMAQDATGQVNFDDYQIGGSTQPYVVLRYRLDEPSWWPDVALSYARLIADGNHTVSAGTDLDGVVVLAPTVAHTRADVNDATLGFSYAVLDAPVNLNLGIAVRYLNGNLLINDSSAASVTPETINQVFPLLIASARWPITDWLSVAADGAWIRAEGDGAYEFYAGAELSQIYGVSLQAGWMIKRYNVNNDSYQFDARLEGPRLGLLWRFDQR